MKYKLKKEARPFFSDNLAKTIETLDGWKKRNIPKELLEEIPPVYVVFGQKISETNTSLSNWSKEKAQFKFTLEIKEMPHAKYDNIKIHDLMDEMQKATNKFFKEYLTK